MLAAFSYSRAPERTYSRACVHIMHTRTRARMPACVCYVYYIVFGGIPPSFGDLESGEGGEDNLNTTLHSEER